MFYTDPEHEPFLFEAGSSRALLIHGFLGSPRELRPLAQELADAGVTARGVLLPGFGADIARLEDGASRGMAGRGSRGLGRDPRGRQPHHLDRVLDGRRGRAAAGRGGRAGAGSARPAGAALEVRRPPRGRPARGQVSDPRVQTVWPHRLRQSRHAPHAGRAGPRRRPRRSRGAPRASQLRHHSHARPRRAAPGRRRRGAGASRVSAPATIVQGLQDTTTLPAYSRQLAARMGADLREIPGDHLIVDPERPSWNAVRDAVVRLATGTGAA